MNRYNWHIPQDKTNTSRQTNCFCFDSLRHRHERAFSTGEIEEEKKWSKEWRTMKKLPLFCALSLAQTSSRKEIVSSSILCFLFFYFCEFVLFSKEHVKETLNKFADGSAKLSFEFCFRLFLSFFADIDEVLSLPNLAEFRVFFFLVFLLLFIWLLLHTELFVRFEIV